MLTILAQEPAADVTTPVQEPQDFEIVLGRRHVASVLFLATVVLAVISGMSYLAGRSTALRKPPPAVVPVAQPVAQVVAAQRPEPALPEPPPMIEPPIFGDPVSGAIYLQMGSVERGVSVILVEGLRKHGFDAFAAPGTSDKVYRVLIGPLPDPQAFLRAKDAVDQIGLATFARKYQQ
jgi:cell division septation protein DedD